MPRGLQKGLPARRVYAVRNRDPAYKRRQDIIDRVQRQSFSVDNEQPLVRNSSRSIAQAAALSQTRAAQARANEAQLVIEQSDRRLGRVSGMIWVSGSWYRTKDGLRGYRRGYWRRRSPGVAIS